MFDSRSIKREIRSRYSRGQKKCKKKKVSVRVANIKKRTNRYQYKREMDE